MSAMNDKTTSNVQQSGRYKVPILVGGAVGLAIGILITAVNVFVLNCNFRGVGNFPRTATSY